MKVDIESIRFTVDPKPGHHDNGSLMFGTLDIDQTINKINFRGSSILHLHDNGFLHYGLLNGDQEINNMNFMGNKYIVFHRNGVIRSGVLSKKHTINDVEIGIGWSVNFDSNNQIFSAYPVINYTVGGGMSFRNGKLLTIKKK